mmetsp:Transcript_34978/g.93641  ORF Transcript_34978/g.93641 Transcript_34978/m.93641 type:complete len:312 (+) Transcript_34978:59-994(+)
MFPPSTTSAHVPYLLLPTRRKIMRPDEEETPGDSCTARAPPRGATCSWTARTTARAPWPSPPRSRRRTTSACRRSEEDILDGEVPWPSWPTTLRTGRPSRRTCRTPPCLGPTGTSPRAARARRARGEALGPGHPRAAACCRRKGRCRRSRCGWSARACIRRRTPPPRARPASPPRAPGPARLAWAPGPRRRSPPPARRATRGTRGSGSTTTGTPATRAPRPRAAAGRPGAAATPRCPGSSGRAGPTPASRRCPRCATGRCRPPGAAAPRARATRRSTSGGGRAAPSTGPSAWSISTSSRPSAPASWAASAW